METVKSAVSTLVGAENKKVPVEPDDWLKANEVEKIEPDEEEKSRKIGEAIRKMQNHNFDQHQHKYRGTHVKSLAFVKGTLTINPDLPKHLQQGLFIPSKSYEVIARYANEPSFLLPDTQKSPRGLGLKIFGVEGKRLLSSSSSAGSVSQDNIGNGGDGGEQRDGTQDMLFNNSPMIELTDINTCLEILELREKYFNEPLKLQGALALRNDRMKQFAPSMLPNNYIIGMDFFTQSSFAFGPYVAHFSLSPISPSQESFKDKVIPSDASETFHRQSLNEYYTSQSSKYSLRAQFASDISLHPVEDSSTEWDQTTSPYHDLAVLEFPAQETFSDERRIWWEEKIALSPWNGIEDHRPLGSINRLRRKVYEMSRGNRGQTNLVKVEFPRNASEMPN